VAGEERSTRRAIVLKVGTYHLQPFMLMEHSMFLTACGKSTRRGNPTTEHWCQQQEYRLCTNCRVAWDKAKERYERSPKGRAKREGLQGGNV